MIIYKHFYKAVIISKLKNMFYLINERCDSSRLFDSRNDFNN